MTLFFTIVCIFGKFVLLWRRSSLITYFDRMYDAPGIFHYGLGSLFVLAVGWVAYWGSALLILINSDWPWAVLALVLGFVFQYPLLTWLCEPPLGRRRSSSAVPKVAASQVPVHFKVTYNKHFRWDGRVPIADNKFPEVLFGEFGTEERFFSTLKHDEFERACKNSPVVIGYSVVDPETFRRAVAEAEQAVKSSPEPSPEQLSAPPEPPPISAVLSRPKF
jgi:hypothetical protein